MHKEHMNQTKKIGIVVSIFEEYPIDFAYIFGSSIKQEVGPLSDVDLAVYFNSKIPQYDRHKNRLDLISRLESIFTPVKVDLIVLNDSNYLLADEIMRTGQCIVDKKPRVKQQFTEYIITRSLDFKPFANKFDKWQYESINQE